MVNKSIDINGLVDLLADQQGRQITAVAGPPGAGKSTLAEAIVERLNATRAGLAAVFPMDGYHFDDRVLNERGHRPRKGAPHTFDVAGYAHMLKRLKANTETEIAVPVFDRSIEIARAGARIIPASVQHIITEGNYLLLDREPWSSLQPLFDRTIFIDVPRPIIEQRLLDRWQDLDPAAQRQKIAGNDLPNVDLVISHSRAADFTITTAG